MTKIKLALYVRKSGAQGCTYYGTLKYVYRIVNWKKFRVPKRKEDLRKLEENGIVEYIKPQSEKILYSSSSSFGGMFEYEKMEYYEVEAPVLLETVSIYEGKRNYSFRLVNCDIDEEPKPKYDKLFADVIAEAEKIDNRSGIPIEELKKLRCRFIGANRDNLHGDDFDSYELENGCKATLFYRRTLSADIGYRFDYTKLLRIYPP
ncbi:MAG: hypothetical protein QW228_07850 [Candidatus Aenigmatarchaeota archaeon]